MSRLPNRLTALLLAGVLVGSLLAAGPVAGDGTDDGADEPGATETMSADQTPVEVEIDCDANRVELTAPEDYRYDATVAVANLTPTSNEVSRSTVGSLEGNETVEFDGEGIVFVFVRESAGDDSVVASAVTDCSAAAGETTTTDEATTAESDDAPEIRIDCNGSEVDFVAPEDEAYVAKVVSVSVSPAGTSTQSATRTLEGNETVSVDDANALVAAFASTGDLGDDRTVSAIRNCSPYGDERLSANATDADRRGEGPDA